MIFNKERQGDRIMVDSIILTAVKNKGDIEALLRSSEMEHEDCNGGKIILTWDENKPPVLTCQKCKNIFYIWASSTDLISLLEKRVAFLYINPSYPYSGNIFTIGWKDLLEQQKELYEEREASQKETERWIKIIVLSLLMIFVIAIIFFG